jgi:hypothetical protein
MHTPPEIKKRGGRRTGSGNKPGVPLKTDDERRELRKTYRFSEQEHQKIVEAVQVSGIEESKIVREGALKEAKRVMRRANNGVNADAKQPRENLE